MSANAFKTLFLLLTRLATCTQCALNEKNVSKYTHSNTGIRTFGVINLDLRMGIDLCRVTDDFGADINSELTRKKRDISVK